MVGAIELRGRLPPSTRLAIGRPSLLGLKEKSVISLLSKNPCVMSMLPNPDSIVVVIETILPLASTMLKWLVPAGSNCCIDACAVVMPGGSPGGALPMEVAG